MKPSKNMTVLLISSLIIVSCNITEQPKPQKFGVDVSDSTIKLINSYKNILADKSILVGGVDLEKVETKLHTIPGTPPDLSNIKNNDDTDLKGKPLRYIAIGGSLTAGVRDGGYFNDGMNTSYPNLIARQMKLAEFKLPLFSDNEFNGVGVKTATDYNPTGGPINKFVVAKNNLGIRTFNENELILNTYKGDIDLLGIPNLTRYGLEISDEEPTELRAGAKFFRPFLRRLERYSSLPNLQYAKNLNKLLNTNKADFYTIELGLHDLLNAISEKEYIYTASILGSGFPEISPDKSIIRKLLLTIKDAKIVNSGSKLCVATVPSPFDLLYFNKITLEELKTATESQNIWASSNFLVSANDAILPTTAIDSLMSSRIEPKNKKGLLQNYSLSTTKSIFVKEGIDRFEDYYLRLYNENIYNLSREYKFAVVDLFTLYKKIRLGTFITDDGIKVTLQNFYSLDSFNPTPFGQAVVANEFIKSINSFYKIKIELIKTAEYIR